MKLYKILVLTIIFSIISFSCNQQKTKWQGTIKEVNGVTIVKNPIEPMYGEEIIEIEKDLSIKEDLSDEGLLNTRSLSRRGESILSTGGMSLSTISRMGDF